MAAVIHAPRITWKPRFQPTEHQRDPVLTARLAIDHETMEEAWALRYECYSHYGYLAPDPKRSFPDVYDNKPTSRTVVLYRNGFPAGSVRVCQHDPELAASGNYTMPVMTTFPDIIPEVINSSIKKIGPTSAIEILRLVAHPKYEKNSEIVFGLFRMAKYLMKSFDAKIVFCAVRANHIGLYRRTGLTKIAEPRHYYEKLSFDTALMFGLEPEFEELQEKIPCFSGVHKKDGIYDDLLSGKLIPVHIHGPVPEQRRHSGTTGDFQEKLAA